MTDPSERIRIGQIRCGPAGDCQIMRVEGDAVKVREPDGIAVWDKPTVLTWPFKSDEATRGIHVARDPAPAPPAVAAAAAAETVRARQEADEIKAHVRIRCPKCGATSPCMNYGPGCP